MKLSVKELVYISILACIQVVIFNFLSNVLYLEWITLTTVLFALVFERKICVLASLIFAIVNMLIVGVNVYTIMYLLIYPLYSCIISLLKNFLINHFILICIFTGLLSFLTGQLLQLPWILISKKATMIYIIIGLKTSLLQGLFNGLSCFLCFKPLYKVLSQIERNI